jgi:hypothetical protein
VPPNLGACCDLPGLECRYGYYYLGDESFVCDEVGNWVDLPSECPV